MMKKHKKTNRDVVLEVAASLFLTKGYLATSMDEIVAVSKVSKTNIYYYFKSKEELLSAILDQLVHMYSGMIAEAASRTDKSVRERFEALLHMLTRQELECLGGCPFLTLYTQMPQDVPVFKEKLSRFFRDQVATVEALLIEGMNKREFKAGLPVGPTAQFIVSAIEGGLFLRHASQNPTLLEDSLLSLAFLLK